MAEWIDVFHSSWLQEFEEILLLQTLSGGHPQVFYMHGGSRFECICKKMG